MNGGSGKDGWKQKPWWMGKLPRGKGDSFSYQRSTGDRKSQSFYRCKISDFYLPRRRWNILMPKDSLFSLFQFWNEVASPAKSRDVPVQSETWLLEIFLLISMFPQMSFLVPMWQETMRMHLCFLFWKWMNEPQKTKIRKTFVKWNHKGFLDSKSGCLWSRG